MTNVRIVRKRCDVCRKVVKVRQSQRVCMQLERNKKGFMTGYRCPGKLQRVVRKRKSVTEVPLPKGAGLGYVLSEEYQQQVNAARGDKWRSAALRALTRAEERHKAAAQDAAAAEKRMRKWTKEIRKQQARAAMSDEEVAAVRARAERALQVSHVKRRLAKSAGVDPKGAQ